MNSSIDFLLIDVVAYNDFYPYGMQMTDRYGSEGEYCYGFGSQEKDDEVKGKGNSYTTYYRHYDPRIGRWKSLDPEMEKYASHSPYNYNFNSPLNYTDIEGDSPISVLAKLIAKKGAKIVLKKYAKRNINNRLKRYMTKEMRGQLVNDLDNVLSTLDQPWWETAIEVVPIAGDLYGAGTFGVKIVKAWGKLQKLENKYVEKVNMDVLKVVSEARKLSRLGRDADAIELLSRIELNSSGDANYLLGQIYELADSGVSDIKGNIKKAIFFYEKALKLGCSDAGLELANIYFLGDYVRENLKKAEKYWKMASDMGNDIASFELANHYYDNDRFADSIFLYEELIDHSEFGGNASYKLAILFLEGKGTWKDIDKAIKFLNLGVSKNNPNSYLKLGWLYYKGEIIEKDIDKAISLFRETKKFELFKEESESLLFMLESR